jgi:hypothetical protein
MIVQFAALRKLLPLLSCCLFVGCGPQLSPEELGTVVHEVPKFDPYEEKYPLPKLPPAPATEEGASHSHDGHSHDGHNHEHGHQHDHDHGAPAK